MKKSSLMGASVVAAALLAAAPVVAPVASLATPDTQVVKAADATEEQNLQKYTTKLISSLKGGNSDNISLDDNDIKAKNFAQPTTELTNLNDYGRADFETGFVSDSGEIGYYDIESSKALAALASDKAFQGNATVGATKDEKDAAKAHLQYTLTYSFNYADGRLGRQVYNTDDLATLAKYLKDNGGSITAHYTFFNGYNNGQIGSADPVYTFKTPSSSTKALFVTVNDVTVPNGTPTSIFNSRGSVADNGGKVLNEKGENIISSLNSDKFDVGSLKYDLVAGKTSGTPVNDTTLQEGTYTQEIKFNLRDIFGAGDDDEHLDVNVTNADNAGRISINGHSFADILAGKVAGMSYDTNKNSSSEHPNGGYLTLTRKVTVGKAGVVDAPYTAEKVDGVVTVTTKEGTAAQVYDQAGNPVYSRALAPGSRWVTGQKRTLLKNGKVYYQVSTNEFLSADDVSYAAKSASSSDHLKGAVKVTQIGKKVFTIAEGNYGYVWAKDDDNNGMHLVKSRFLAPNSKWQSGAKANMTDSNGNTHEFYQVSTNEWIDGSVGSIN